MNKRIFEIGVLILLCGVFTSLITTYANQNINHPSSSHVYASPSPIYKNNDTAKPETFASDEGCVNKIAKTETSIIKSKEIKTYGQYIIDEKVDAQNYIIESKRMVRVIKVEYPDGLETKAGFYKKAKLTTVWDAETGDYIESCTSGERVTTYSPWAGKD
ncbi:MAG: hypothetical protein WC677_01825 [Clostridia bacterium]|jgi:hypothetical protein